MSACPRRVYPLLLAALTFSTTDAAAQGFNRNYRPTSDVVLDTDGTWIQPERGPRVWVPSGVFLFNSVTIPAGVTVRGIGSRPMLWVVFRDFVVEGRLSVDGEEGESALRPGVAHQPTHGGRGSCTGGDGGAGSPVRNDRSLTGQPGFGPFQTAGLGGGPGRLACANNCGRASAGGGGTFATAGDPYYPPDSNDTWDQLRGRGARGCFNLSLRGGAPGTAVFVDGVVDNDFWGPAVDLNRGRLVIGELPGPIGGQGGGGGGDRAMSCNQNDPGFLADERGGAGGGGGGVLAILALGRVRIGEHGLVSANGGHGGGGEPYGDNSTGGGGGGGSGGMVIVLSQTRIELVAHGDTYGRGDYSFAISADGGIGTQQQLGPGAIRSKYPPGDLTWSRRATGGFGGLGIVQLISPVGANRDGTNTHLDDGIDVLRGGQPLLGAEKQRYLAWRGFANQAGVLVDDFGNPTSIGSNEGDIRPAPILMPIF